MTSNALGTGPSDVYSASIRARWAEEPAPDDPQALVDENCDLCKQAVGYHEHGDSYRWSLYLSVRGTGDIRDTRFCEDCAGWLADAAGAITSALTPAVILYAPCKSCGSTNNNGMTCFGCGGSDADET